MGFHVSFRQGIVEVRNHENHTPGNNMETQKGPIKTTVPLNGGYLGCHVSLGECII